MFFLVAASILAFSISVVYVVDEINRKPTQYGDKDATLQDLELARPFTERIVSPAMRSASLLVGRIAPQELIARITNLLDRAGYRTDPLVFIATQIFCALALPALFVGLGAGGDAQGMVLLFVSAGMGYWLPYLLVQQQAAKRKEGIQAQLPDVLDLLTVSVESGLGLDMAVSKVVEKMRGPLVDEFARVSYEIKMGKQKRAALKAMADRLEVTDLRQFVAALIQADRLGIGLVQLLRVQSDQMRLRRRQRAEEKAMKAPLKMSFVLALLVLPALLIVVLGPAVIHIFDKLGQR